MKFLVEKERKNKKEEVEEEEEEHNWLRRNICIFPFAYIFHLINQIYTIEESVEWFIN